MEVVDDPELSREHATGYFAKTPRGEARRSRRSTPPDNTDMLRDAGPGVAGGGTVGNGWFGASSAASASAAFEASFAALAKRAEHDRQREQREKAAADRHVRELVADYLTPHTPPTRKHPWRLLTEGGGETGTGFMGVKRRIKILLEDLATNNSEYRWLRDECRYHKIPTSRIGSVLNDLGWKVKRVEAAIAPNQPKLTVRPYRTEVYHKADVGILLWVGPEW